MVASTTGEKRIFFYDYPIYLNSWLKNSLVTFVTFQEHGSTHSSAATSAASQINDLAIVPYNPNSAKTPKTMSTLSNSEKKSKHVENSLESNFQTNCMIDGVEIVRQGNLFKFQKVIKVRQDNYIVSKRLPLSRSMMSPIKISSF